MKNKIQVFFTLIALLISTQLHASTHLPDNLIIKDNQEIIKTQSAIRSVSLRIRLNDDLHGFVESKTCSFCKTIRINITPNTKAYANNVIVPLKQAKTRVGQFATVIYNVKTKNISAIKW